MTDSEKASNARIKWLLIAGSVFVVVSALLLVWVPYQRQMRLIEELETMHTGSLLLGTTVITEPSGPDWLREWVGDERMKGFED